MNEELDSQLSAMFDDELPEQQCVLLAKRLARDEALMARWERYATIGAAIRAERGVRLDGSLARKVSAALSLEPPLSTATDSALSAEPPSRPALRRWWQPAAGAAIAASVAVVSIFWLRGQSQSDAPLLVQGPAPMEAGASLVADSGSSSEPDSYTVPTPVEAPPMMPSAELASFVVAHSEYSSPVTRVGNLLSALVTEPGTANMGAQSEDADANRTDNAQ